MTEPALINAQAEPFTPGTWLVRVWAQAPNRRSRLYRIEAPTGDDAVESAIEQFKVAVRTDDWSESALAASTRHLADAVISAGLCP